MYPVSSPAGFKLISYYKFEKGFNIKQKFNWEPHFWKL